MFQHGGTSQLIPGDRSVGGGGGGGGSGDGVDRTSVMSNAPGSEKLNPCWLFMLKGETVVAIQNSRGS